MKVTRNRLIAQSPRRALAAAKPEAKKETP